MVTKIAPKKKKCKKAKWLSEESLQIAEKRRDMKGKRARYIQLKEELQRITRRNKKPFLSEQCKEIEGKNRMGKTRDLFKKNHRYQGNISCKMGSIKDRNGMGITEAEDIKR